MFTKKPDVDATVADVRRAAVDPVRPERGRRAGAGRSVIGEDLVITGNLNSQGEVEIEGEVQGDVRAKRVVVGERAHVTGTLIAEEVVVRGGVQGQIRGISVTFQATSRVEGDIFHKSLLIEQGALFEGRSRRSEDPMTIPRGVALPPAAMVPPDARGRG
jgi:cytoskeletal protein CcmA (bactofilin family)